MQLLQTETDEKPSQVLLTFSTRLMTKQCLIRNYAVKVRQRELRAGGNKLSAARGLRKK
jgi:hypothetical protein